MNAKEAKSLKVGDKIATDELPEGEHHEGIVTEVGYAGVKTEWDDGQIGNTAFEDMKKFYMVKP